MAPRRKPDPLLNDDESLAEISAPLPSDSSPPLTKREAAKLKGIDVTPN